MNIKPTVFNLVLSDMELNRLVNILQIVLNDDGLKEKLVTKDKDFLDDVVRTYSTLCEKLQYV